MPELAWAYDLLGRLPFDCLELRFMQQALFGLLLLAPMASVLGVEVISFRMAFFSDAIGHSAFAGYFYFGAFCLGSRLYCCDSRENTGAARFFCVEIV